jgi:hypothetical protein
MKMLLSGLRISGIAVVVLLGGTGVASSITLWLPLPAVDDPDGHRSSLRATVTMTDGTNQTVTLQGVGCTENICSRVRALDVKSKSLWLDELASVHAISRGANGAVTAVITFRDGRERQASIVQGNRVLYIKGHFGRTERLDLARIARIDFE